MTRLDDLQPIAAVLGTLPDQGTAAATLRWFPPEHLTLTYKTLIDLQESDQ